MTAARREIGDLLVDNGVITPEELARVRFEKEKTGQTFPHILSRLGLAGENQLKNALELEYGVNFVNLRKVEPDTQLIAMLPEPIIREHLAVAIGQDGSRITVAMVDPANSDSVNEVKQHLNGAAVKTVVCLEDDFEQFVNSALKPVVTETAQADSNGDKSGETVAESQPAPPPVPLAQSLPPPAAPPFQSAPTPSPSAQPALSPLPVAQPAPTPVSPFQSAPSPSPIPPAQLAPAPFSPAQPASSPFPPAQAAPTAVSPFQSAPSPIQPAQPAPSPIPPAQPAPSSIPPAQPAPSPLPPAQPAPSSIPPAQPAPSAIPPAQPAPSAIPPAQPAPSSIPPAQPAPSSIPQAQPAPSSIPPAQPVPSSIPPAQPAPPPVPPARPPQSDEAVAASIPGLGPAPFAVPPSPVAPGAAAAAAETAQAVTQVKESKASSTGSFPILDTSIPGHERTTEADGDGENLSDQALARRAQEEAIVLLANQILGGAIKRHCSNIHITAGEKQAIVQYRLNGMLYVDRKLPRTILTALIARYKMMARMNLGERNLPQDGHIKVKSSSKEIVCLVSTIPTELGEHVVIWIL